MALAATCSPLYIAQRKRLRGKRLLAQTWFLGKCVLLVALCVGLAWGSKIVYTLVWNQTPVGDAAAQAAAREGRRKSFQAAVDKMAAAANAP